MEKGATNWTVARSKTLLTEPVTLTTDKRSGRLTITMERPTTESPRSTKSVTL